MYEPTTVKGFITLMRRIELMIPESLKGFDDLSEDDKQYIRDMSSEISNHINEVEHNKICLLEKK